jgi:Gluconate kinase
MRVVVMGRQGSAVALAAAAVAAGVRAEFVDGDDLRVRAFTRTPGSTAEDVWLTLVATALQHPDTVVACPLLPRTYRNLLRSRVPDVRFVELVAGSGGERRTRVPRRDRAARAARAARETPPTEAFTPLGEDEPGIRVADDADLPSVVARIVALLNGAA